MRPRCTPSGSRRPGRSSACSSDGCAGAASGSRAATPSGHLYATNGRAAAMSGHFGLKFRLRTADSGIEDGHGPTDSGGTGGCPRGGRGRQSDGRRPPRGESRPATEHLARARGTVAVCGQYRRGSRAGRDLADRRRQGGDVLLGGGERGGGDVLLGGGERRGGGVLLGGGERRARRGGRSWRGEPIAARPRGEGCGPPRR